MENKFSEIINLIHQAQENAVRAVNSEKINLYWKIGKHLSHKIESSKWGTSVVEELSEYLQKKEPKLNGFSDKNLWRMKQFYEAYKDYPKLSTALREISWSHNLAIFSRCDSIEEKEFYLKTARKENYTVRNLNRQISSSLFERTMIGNSNLSTSMREMDADFINTFKDSYVFDFLDLPKAHSENELQKGLINQMKELILELGKDFLFIDSEYKVEVGNSDFYIDLLFYHRGLQCLVAFELKTDKFRPEHLGQLNFYLEALDRDKKKSNENPSIGILICKDKDQEVVEYALSRSLSPTMVSEYKTKLPDKKLLQEKLQRVFDNDDEEEQ